MVVFFQPTFHKYFLEQAQGLNPNLAHSCSDVIEFTCLGFCLPHLPSRVARVVPLSSLPRTGESADCVWRTVLQRSEEAPSPFLHSYYLPLTLRKLLSTLCSLGAAYQFPPPLSFTSQPPRLLSSKNKGLHQLGGSSSEKYPLGGVRYTKIFRSRILDWSHLWLQELTMSWGNMHSSWLRDSCISKRGKIALLLFGAWGEDLAVHTSGWSEKSLRTPWFPR